MNKNLLRKIDLLSPPHREIINQYKRQEVFRCTHETHLHFNSAVSAHHILKVKKCYPQGCIYFKWKCKKLNKGAPCPKKYKHVGRTCFNCRYFYDIKVIKRPEVILPLKEFEQFKKDFKAFENWLKSHQGRLVEFSGMINSVKPRYSLKMTSGKTYVFFEGFLLNFLESSINATPFRDFIYVPISSRMQARFNFAKGDSVSLSGYFTVKNGSIVLQKVRGIEILERGDTCFWTESRARVAQRTGSILKYQSEKCFSCDKGILLHIRSDDAQRKGSGRRMFCLEGVEDPQFCYYSLQRNLMSHECLMDNEPDCAPIST